jgi:acetyl esterase/lipase
MDHNSLRSVVRWALPLLAAAAFAVFPQTAQRTARPAQQPKGAARKQQVPSVEQMKKRVPPGVKYMPDLAYREGNPAWRVDLAMPEAAGNKPRPGVVIVHGGGWRSGDKRVGMWGELPLDYAQKGYVAISVNYRFVTESPMPACIEDVKCAVRWFRAHAKEFNLDPKRVGGFGYSAGAHLVAMLALSGSDAGLEGDGPYRDQPSNLQAACVGGTPSDFLNWGSERSPRAGGVSSIFGGTEETATERARRFSPITYASASAPPMLVMHGNNDTTVPLSQAERLVKALRDAGAKNLTFIIFDASGHSMFNAHSAETRPAMMGFFDSTIGKD